MPTQAISSSCLKSRKWTKSMMLWWNYYIHMVFLLSLPLISIIISILLNVILNWKALIVWKIVVHCLLVDCATCRICIYSSSLFWCMLLVLLFYLLILDNNLEDNTTTTGGVLSRFAYLYLVTQRNLGKILVWDFTSYLMFILMLWYKCYLFRSGGTWARHKQYWMR